MKSDKRGVRKVGERGEGKSRIEEIFNGSIKTFRSPIKQVQGEGTKVETF